MIKAASGADFYLHPQCDFQSYTHDENCWELATICGYLAIVFAALTVPSAIAS